MLQNDFETLFTINNAPRDAALFGSKDGEHCFFYFSPGAVAIAHGLISTSEVCPPRLRAKRNTPRSYWSGMVTLFRCSRRVPIQNPDRSGSTKSYAGVKATGAATLLRSR